MATRYCKECGKQFETTSSRRQVCYDIHYRTCRTCGKVYPVAFEELSREPYCSKECATYAKVSAPQNSAPHHLEICEICGKEFYSKRGRSRICNEHTTLICKYCGKEFKASRSDILAGKQTCSSKCRYALAQATYTSNYGKETNPDNFAKMQKKYQTSCLSTYGVSNPMQNSAISAKSVDTKRKLYGDHLEALTEKRSITTLSRYGAEHIMQVEAFKEKAKQTCLAKYGVDNYAKSTKFLLDAITDPSKADECKAFRDDPRHYVLSNFTDHKPTLKELSECCGIRESSVGWILDKSMCTDIVSYDFSAMEDEVYRFLLTCVSEEDIVRNTFKIITPYELDIYLPRFNIAIECNPTITHNSTVPGFGEHDVPKSPNYHKMKTDMCEAKGIFLFHIFGYEWTYKKDIVKSMLKSLLRQSTRKIYARSTEVTVLSDRECSCFLEHNHRQGAAHSAIRLGLVYKSELVAVMTFSKMRSTIGMSKDASEGCYELVRFCNIIDTNVVGGASKLFRHFVQTYHPTEIRSFSDRAHTKGSLYSKLGFTYSHTSDPGYMWVNFKTDRGYARSNAQKHNIIKFLQDDSIDLTKTEVQIMSEHGYVQVFDSGVILWVWRGEQNEN